MWNPFPSAMSEFKYACPVCGQHMKCDSSQSGTVMECPTCFQKITAPQAPATDDPKFIITGTKVGERPIPAAVANAEAIPAPAPGKNFPWPQSFSSFCFAPRRWRCLCFGENIQYRRRQPAIRTAPDAPRIQAAAHPNRLLARHLVVFRWRMANWHVNWSRRIAHRAARRIRQKSSSKRQ